jgi:hypothetical protein
VRGNAYVMCKLNQQELLHQQAATPGPCSSSTSSSRFKLFTHSLSPQEAIAQLCAVLDPPSLVPHQNLWVVLWHYLVYQWGFTHRSALVQPSSAVRKDSFYHLLPTYICSYAVLIQLSSKDHNKNTDNSRIVHNQVTKATPAQ